MNIAEAFRKTYFAALKSVTGFRVLIIDSQIQQVTSHLIPNSSNVSLGISTIMRIEHLSDVKGKAMLWTNCIIITSPTDENIQYIVSELKNQHFGDLYIFLTTRPNREHLEVLAREDRDERIKSLKILFTFFHPEYPDLFYGINIGLSEEVRRVDTDGSDDSVFRVERITKVTEISPADSLHYEAESLLSALRSLGRMPFCVRHTNTPSTIEFLRQLDKSVGNDGRWSGFKYDARGFPIAGGVEKPMLPFELIIMDRRDDVMSSIQTDYSLSGMLKEIGGLWDGVVHINIAGKDVEFSYNVLTDPTGLINKLGSALFTDAVKYINDKVKELLHMGEEMKNLSSNLKKRESKQESFVEAIQEVLTKQEEVVKRRKLLSELQSVLNQPSRIGSEEKWGRWLEYLGLLAKYASKRNLSDRTNIGREVKDAIKVLREVVSSPDVGSIAYAVLKIVFAFMAGFPEVVLRTSSSNDYSNLSSPKAKQSAAQTIYSQEVRDICVDAIKRFYCSKDKTILSDQDAEEIVDKFANYCSRNYRGIDWNKIYHHPLNKPSKLAKINDTTGQEDADGMFSLDFTIVGDSKKEVKKERGEEDVIGEVLKPSLKYIPLSASLATLAIRNEHKDLVPVYEHLTDKRVLESVNSKTKVVHDVLIYIVGGVSYYEHIVPSPIGSSNHPSAFRDRERIASLLSNHCIIGGTSILTPRSLISDVCGKPMK